MTVQVALAETPAEVWADKILTYERTEHQQIREACGPPKENPDCKYPHHAPIAEDSSIEVGISVAYVDEVWQDIRSTGHACDAIGFMMWGGGSNPPGSAYVLQATGFAAVVCGVKGKANVLYRVSQHSYWRDDCQPSAEHPCAPGQSGHWVTPAPSVTRVTPEQLQTELSQDAVQQSEQDSSVPPY